MTHPKVSIIILNWNGLEDTIECLESLKKITYPNYELVVVDNGSRGDDAQVLREKFGDYIHLIQNDRNYGYTGGNNIGIRYALTNSSPDYLLILNNDIVVASDFLTEMVKVAEGDTSVGVVGPKVYYYKFPDLLHSVGVKINMRKGCTTSIGHKERDRGQRDVQREVDYVAGCCLLVRQEVIEKVGLFDESYFCYWDETDFCTRVKRAKYRIVSAPSAKIWHKAPIKAKVWQETAAEAKANASGCYYSARNNFKFMRKHATMREYCSFLLYFFGYRFWFMTAVWLLYHRSPRLFIGFCRGVRDGLFNSERGARLYLQN